MSRKVYSRSKNNKYNHNPRYTKKIVQSGGDQTTYSAYVPNSSFVILKPELEAVLKRYGATFKKENEYEIHGIPTNAVKKTKLFLLNTKGIPPKNIEEVNKTTDIVDFVVFSNTEINVSELKEIDSKIELYINPSKARRRVKITVTMDTSNADAVLHALKSGNLKQLSFDKDKLLARFKSYTIEAPPNDTNALKNVGKYFGDTKVTISPIVKQAVIGSDITVNTFIDEIKKIKIKRKNGQETPLEISSHSPADGGTITVKTPYKIVNAEKEYGTQDGFKYVEVFTNITDRLKEYLETLKGGVKKTKGKETIVVSDTLIKKTETIRNYPELDAEENKNKTYISLKSLKLPSGSKISKTLSESDDVGGTKQFTQTITGVGADIIGELKRKGLEVRIDKGNGMIVRPTPGSKIDKIVNITDYGISVPDGTVKYVEVFTNPTPGVMHNLRESSKDGILQIKKTQIGDTAGFYETATFISDKSIKETAGTTPGQTYIALKLPTGKVEEPVVLLTVTISDADPEEKKKLSKFLIQYPKYKVYDAAGNDVTITLELEPGEKSEEILKMALKELLTEKPEKLLEKLNDMPSFTTDVFDDKKFDDLYKALIDNNDGLKVKGSGFKTFITTSLIIKPTDLITKISLYHILYWINWIKKYPTAAEVEAAAAEANATAEANAATEAKTAAEQFFNSLKEIFNILYKEKTTPDNEDADKKAVEIFIRKLYDSTYPQTKDVKVGIIGIPEHKNAYKVAYNVANLVADKVTKSFESPVKGGRLTRRRVLNRRNKKKSHRSKLN